MHTSRLQSHLSGRPQRRSLAAITGIHVSREHQPPPSVVSCPQCSRPLAYTSSYLVKNEKSVSLSEYFECTFGCGMFERRRGSTRLHKVLHADRNRTA